MTDPLARRLAADPALFPHSLDLAEDRLLLIETDEPTLADASFLDQRLLGPQTRGSWMPMTQVMQAADADGRDDAHYIFHIGHVGSTLVSRLLGRLPGVLALREPLVLRGIAEAVAKAGAADAPWNPETIEARTAMLRRLLGRTFSSDQRAIIKATSFTSEIAPQLVARGARALFLRATPENYMRTILAGDASRRELAMLTGPRLIRLTERLGPLAERPWSLDEGARVALGWMTEMLSLAAAAAALPAGSVLWMDFDTMLADPAEALLRIAGHFGLAIDAAGAAELAADPLMQRYSKAPEHGYSADLRRQLQEQAAQEHGATLARGQAWLDAMATRHEAVARMIEGQAA